jgi:micrococcal nuclease
MLGRQGSTVLKLGILVVAGFTGYLSATAVTGGVPDQRSEVAAPAWFTLRAKVTRIVDGDTLIARVSVRRSERVRLIGIDTPEVGRCFAAQATLTARKLALNRRVKLQGDRTQSRRDRFGRLLAYVLLPNGRDLGRELIRSGRGVVFVFRRPFAKLASYRAAEAAARSARLGLWSACVAPPTTSTTTTATTTTTTSSSTTTTTTTTSTATTTTSTTTTPTTTAPPANCAPSYPTVCIPPPPPDLDCGDIPYRNFTVIYTVPDPDPHRFDGDHDGIGCET